jgi:outer membrane protein TolC
MLVAARQTVVAAEAAVAAARTGFGVTVTARGGASAGRSTAAEGSISSSASLVASHTLYDSGQTAAAVAQAEASLRAARATLDATRQDAALAVGVAYVAVLRGESALVLQQQQVIRAQELVRIAQGQFDAGAVPRSDVVRAQAELASVQSDLIAAQNTVDQAKATLNVATGTGPMTPLAAAPAPDAPQVTVSQTDLARLIEQRPELLKAAADVDAAEAAVRTAQAAGGLQVTLDGSAGQSFTPTSQTTYSIGANVSFPISDAGRNAASVAQAAANLQAVRARGDSARLAATQDAVNALLTVGSARARLASAQAGVVLAAESLRLAQGRYAAGAGPIFEVTDAQTTLLQAEVTLANARFDQLAGILQLRWALGRSIVDGAL